VSTRPQSRASGSPVRDPRPETPAPGEVLVVVPAYNEERSLPATLLELRRDCPWADAVIVDDGSGDGTRAAAAALGYRVLALPFNLGIGGAVQTGFQYAVGRGYRAVVQVDADGQHPPAEILRIVRPVLAGECDVAVGSRFLSPGGYRQTLWRRAGIAILAGVVSVATGRRVTDPTSGFRAYSPAAVGFLARDYPYDYPEPEALVALHRAGLRVVEVPVAMRPRRDGASSIGAVVGARYMFKVLLAIGVSLLRARPSSVRVPTQARRLP
jgi:glycosyltransferase involved in cell wall biosynthesis